MLDQISTALRRGDQVLVARASLNGVRLARRPRRARLLLPSGGSAGDLRVLGRRRAAAMSRLGAVQLRRALGRLPLPRRASAGAARRSSPSGCRTTRSRSPTARPASCCRSLVTELLSPAANAYWYAVWMMAWVVFVIPVQVGHDALRRGRRTARARSACSSASASARRSCSASRPPRRSSGRALARAVAPRRAATPRPAPAPLRILLVSLVPMTFVQAYYAGGRARRRLTEATDRWPPCRASPAVHGGGLAGQAYGLEGVAIAWVAVQLLAGAWAAVAPGRIARAGGASASTAPSLPRPRPSSSPSAPAVAPRRRRPRSVARPAGSRRRRRGRRALSCARRRSGPLRSAGSTRPDQRPRARLGPPGDRSTPASRARR